ncbi:TonB-dependent receptor domain-containing protein [Flexibacterium corallicola]|uniref:TonB-dependent receptor domain-containing protein n=1 Tax=Flexibacterium corallicola TaxID=3037259 RepID=UPI00286F98A5|nr:TonB-dependent receptor [Pseudovibrio sp. M1P-2-3]
MWAQGTSHRSVLICIKNTLKSSSSLSAGLSLLLASSAYAQDGSVEEVELDPVVVIVGETTAKTVAKSTVDSETLERLQSSSVVEALSTLPNVNLEGGIRFGGQTFSIWGFAEQEDVRVTFDGVQKDFEKYKQGSIYIEPELLKKIEVDKGSFSAEKYGSFGGSVEMTSKSANDMLEDSDKNYGSYVKLGYGTNGDALSTTGAVYGRSDEYGSDLLISTTRRSNAKLVSGDGERLLLSDLELWSGHFKGSIDREAHSFELSGAYSYNHNREPYDNQNGQLDLSSIIDRYGWDEALRRFSVDRLTRDATLSAKYNYNPDSDLVNLSIHAGWALTDQKDDREYQAPVTTPTLGGDKSWLSYESYNLDIKNSSVFNTGDFEHSINYGLQLRHHKRDSWAFTEAYKNLSYFNYGNYPLYYSPGGQEVRQSVWAEYSINYNDVLQVTPGIRYDHIKLDGTGNPSPAYNLPGMHDYSSVTYSGWSPSLSTLLKINNNISLFADIAYKMRAPIIDEVYSVDSLTYSSQQLEAERNIAKRVGLVFTKDNLFTQGDIFKTRISYFHNDIRQNIELLNGRDNRNAFFAEYGSKPDYFNARGYYTQGIELEAYYDSRYLFGSLALSWMDGEINGEVYDTFSSNNERVPEISPLTLTTIVGFKVPDYDITAGWKAKFVDDIDHVYGFDGYDDAKGFGVHDIFASWTPQEGRFKDLELRASVENVFDKEYTPYMSLYPAKGRNFKASLSYKF